MSRDRQEVDSVVQLARGLVKEAVTMPGGGTHTFFHDDTPPTSERWERTTEIIPPPAVSPPIAKAQHLDKNYKRVASLHTQSASKLQEINETTTANALMRVPAVTSMKNTVLPEKSPGQLQPAETTTQPRLTADHPSEKSIVPASVIPKAGSVIPPQEARVQASPKPSTHKVEPIPSTPIPKRKKAVPEPTMIEKIAASLANADSIKKNFDRTLIAYTLANDKWSQKYKEAEATSIVPVKTVLRNMINLATEMEKEAYKAWTVDYGRQAMTALEVAGWHVANRVKEHLEPAIAAELLKADRWKVLKEHKEWERKKKVVQQATKALDELMKL